MIRSLRARHRAWTLALAILVPIGFAAAIAARPTWPATQMADWWPDAAEAAAAAESRSWRVSSWRVEELDLDLTLAFGPTPGKVTVTVVPGSDARLPSVLIYGSAQAEIGDALPGDARLIGTLAGAEPRSLIVEDEPSIAAVYFYSLAHREVVAAARLATYD